MAEKVDAWGAPERYYAAWEYVAEETAVSTRWEQHINHVAPGSEDDVGRAVKHWNQRVRTHLAAEMGFQMKGRQVSIRIVPGLPPPLADKLDGDFGVEAVMLNRPLLSAVVEGMKFMADARDLMRSADDTIIGPAQPEDLGNVRDTAQAWLAWAHENDVSQGLGELDVDVLGAYLFKPRDVLIFWLPISIFAAAHQFPIDALTVVVLAHELAHAYTHLGYDIDGFDWRTEDFSESDRAVVEGLAQFYTHIVCRNLSPSIPEAERVFDRLLAEQHAIYRTQTRWTATAGEHSREVVRTGMVEGRRAQQPLETVQFGKTVANVAARLAASTPASTPAAGGATD